MTWGDSAAVSALKYACKALRPGQIHTVSPFAAAGSPTTTQARVQSRVVTWAMEEGVRGATSTFMWRLAHAKALGWPGFAGIFQGRQNAMLYYSVPHHQQASRSISEAEKDDQKLVS